MILFLSDHRRRTIVSAQVIWRTPVSATVPDVRRHLPGRFVNHLSNSKEFKDGQNGAELNITMSNRLTILFGVFIGLPFLTFCYLRVLFRSRLHYPPGPPG